MKFTVRRSDWLRGEEDGLLYRENDGKMCCLGFLGIACGLTEDEMMDRGSPQEALSSLWPRGMVWEDDSDDSSIFYDSTITNELVTINDNQKIYDDTRELALIEKFKELNIEVEFVD